jgi:hypothetical protein
MVMKRLAMSATGRRRRCDGRKWTRRGSQAGMVRTQRRATQRSTTAGPRSDGGASASGTDWSVGTHVCGRMSRWIISSRWGVVGSNGRQDRREGRANNFEIAVTRSMSTMIVRSSFVVILATAFRTERTFLRLHDHPQEGSRSCG